MQHLHLSPRRDVESAPGGIARPPSPSVASLMPGNETHGQGTPATRARPLSPGGLQALDGASKELRHSFMGRPSAGPSGQRLQAMSKMGKVRDFAGLSPVSVASSPDLRQLVDEHPALQRVREAMCTRDAELLNVLLQEHADVVTLPLGADRHTLLHEAVLCKSVDIVNVVLHVPTVELGAVDAHGDSCLHWLCWYSDDRNAVEPIEILQRLLNERSPGVDVDLMDARGFTPLMFAVDQCNDTFVRVLVGHGANVKAQSSQAHTCPILIAVHHGSFAIAEVLLLAGAELDVAGEDNLSPLMQATQRDDLDLVVFLVKSGATVEFATARGTAKELARSSVVAQFLADAAFYQTHHKKKKQDAYRKMVAATRSTSSLPQVGLRDSGSSSSSAGAGSAEPGSPTVRLKRPLGNSREPMPPVVKEYNSENFPLDLDYFDHPALGDARIGMCMCPGRNKAKKAHVWRRNLQADLQVIHNSRADVVVSLVRNVELLSMGILDLFVRVKQLGMESLHFPVVDKWIPESMTSVVELITKLLERCDRGQTLVIHCNGGKGRTGLVACALLVARGLSVDAAIHAIRLRRKGMIRNPAQIVYLRLFETRWKNDHGANSSSSSSSSSSPDGSPAPPRLLVSPVAAEDMGGVRAALRAERARVNGHPAVVVLTVVEADHLADGPVDSFVQLTAVSGPVVDGLSLHSAVARATVHPVWNFLSSRFVVSEVSRWFCTVAIIEPTTRAVLALAVLTGNEASHPEPFWLACVSGDGTAPSAARVRLSYVVDSCKE